MWAPVLAFHDRNKIPETTQEEENLSWRPQWCSTSQAKFSSRRRAVDFPLEFGGLVILFLHIFATGHQIKCSFSAVSKCLQISGSRLESFFKCCNLEGAIAKNLQNLNQDHHIHFYCMPGTVLDA